MFLKVLATWLHNKRPLLGHVPHPKFHCQRVSLTFLLVTHCNEHLVPLSGPIIASTDVRVEAFLGGHVKDEGLPTCIWSLEISEVHRDFRSAQCRSCPRKNAFLSGSKKRTWMPPALSFRFRPRRCSDPVLDQVRSSKVRVRPSSAADW